MRNYIPDPVQVVVYPRLVTPETTSSVIEQWGAFGAILLISWGALVAWILKQRLDIKDKDRELAAVHDQRANELKGFTDRVLKLAEDHNQVQQAQALATHSVAEQLESLDRSVQDLSRDLRAPAKGPYR